MKSMACCFRSWLALALLVGLSTGLPAAEGVGVIKSYLLQQAEKMDAAAHDYNTNATAFAAIIQASDGDYDKAALANDPQLLALIANMQGDYRNLHRNGYETVEGIAIEVKELARVERTTVCV